MKSFAVLVWVCLAISICVIAWRHAPVEDRVSIGFFVKKNWWIPVVVTLGGIVVALMSYDFSLKLI